VRQSIATAYTDSRHCLKAKNPYVGLHPHTTLALEVSLPAATGEDPEELAGLSFH
jgi:hypothetical protein